MDFSAHADWAVADVGVLVMVLLLLSLKLWVLLLILWALSILGNVSEIITSLLQASQSRNLVWVTGDICELMGFWDMFRGKLSGALDASSAKDVNTLIICSMHLNLNLDQDKVILW